MVWGRFQGSHVPEANPRAMALLYEYRRAAIAFEKSGAACPGCGGRGKLHRRRMDRS